jgi:pSer/pThr/pTyr-binding forkhead associated (FHA) protein
MTVRERDTVAHLDFPWGEEPVRGMLCVGRDCAYSPLSGRLQAYPSVSNRHAELRLTPEGLAVRHIGSTNPTYVDGRALASGETALAGDGAEIAFSRALVARLRVER